LRPNVERDSYAPSVPRRSLADMETEARLPGLLRLGESLIILISGVASLAGSRNPDATFCMWAFVLCATLGAGNVLTLLGAYAPTIVLRESLSLPAVYIGRALLGLTVSILAVMATAYFAPPPFASGSWAVTWLFLSLTGVFVLRLSLRQHLLRMQAQGRLDHTIAVVANSRAELEFAQELAKDTRELGNLIGIFSDNLVDEHLAGSLDDLIRVARFVHLDEIKIGLSVYAEDHLDAAVQKLSALPVELRLDPAFSRAGKYQPGGPRRPMPPSIIVQGRPLTGWNGMLKRGEDILSASLFLLFISPFLGLFMLLIRLDSPGPIFFRQQRYGFNNCPFTVLKFRTMFDRPEDPAVPQAQRNDPRITRFGAFLRRTSLDELPQLINVLRGEMSFVGPRPHASAHHEKYSALIDYYLARHRVKPGITGWAQIRGWRGETPTVQQMRARVEHDLYYVDNWSLAFDLYILLKTIPVVLLGRNAW